MCPLNQEPTPTNKPPRVVLETIFAFTPNRDTLGGTAYLIVRKDGNILIDCPAFDANLLNFLHEQGGVRYLFITHRSAIAKTANLQSQLGCEVVINQQEAYLIPEIKVTTFQSELALSPEIQAIWTPGHTPGSSCLYYSEFGGILFTGRHILPDQTGKPLPLRTAKTFHWPRQINSVCALRDKFTPTTLKYICPGANTGFLRSQRFIDNAYEHLVNINTNHLLKAEAIL